MAAKRSFQLPLLGLHQQIGIAQSITTEPSQRKLSKLYPLMKAVRCIAESHENDLVLRIVLANYKLMLH